jgi:hypothetical protein
MKETLEARLAELENEMAIGNEQLIKLNQEREKLESTMLRISVAIQVLKELLQQEENKQVAEANS